MVDYDKASGLGTLRIRDLGSTIEFWAKPYYSDFWWNNLSFNRTANGATTAMTADFDGNAWVKVGSVTVTTSQTVTFRLLTATGTTSLAGPTTHAVSIDRATVPPVPDPVTFSLLDNNSVRGTFTDNGNGGESIDNWYIHRNTSNTLSSGTTTNVGSDRTFDFTGLAPDTTYYFWSRVQNAKGYSGWSAVRSITTHDVPEAPSQPTVTNIKQQTCDVAFTDGPNNGASIDSRQIAWNTSNTVTGATIVASDGSTSLTALPPGQTLYFFARTHNTYGYSPWSPVRSATLIAGAFISDAGVAKRAVPWIKDAGVWKVARPWSKIAGEWKESV